MKFKIKEAREQKGFAQNELAAIIGVAPNTLHGYETGKHDPKSDMLIKIANACDVTVDYLLGVISSQKSPTEEPQGINKNEAELIKLYRQCSPENQKILHLVAENFVLATTAKCQVEEDEQAEVARILDAHASSQSNSEEAGA